MKRMIAFLFLLTLLVCFSLPAFAKIDLTPIRNRSDLYRIDVNDNGHAFIMTKLGLNDRIFSHKYSLEENPSYCYSDIVIMDYFDENPAAAWRLCFDYSAASYLGITSITITMDDVEYTFTGVGGKERMFSHDSYITEKPNIVFGSENDDFWRTLMLKCLGLGDGDAILNMSLPVVLHGTEDVETELDGAAILDMNLMGMALIDMTGEGQIVNLDGTPMKTVNLKPEEKQ